MVGLMVLICALGSCDVAQYGEPVVREIPVPTIPSWRVYGVGVGSGSDPAEARERALHASRESLRIQAAGRRFTFVRSRDSVQFASANRDSVDRLRPEGLYDLGEGKVMALISAPLPVMPPGTAGRRLLLETCFRATHVRRFLADFSRRAVTEHVAHRYPDAERITGSMRITLVEMTRESPTGQWTLRAQLLVMVEESVESTT